MSSITLGPASPSGGARLAATTPAEPTPIAFRGDPIRVLIVPGLHDSSPLHWQSWLQGRFRGSRRVVQRDWSRGELDVWSRRLEEVLEAEPPGLWVAVGHSFGCLALAQHLIARAAAPKAAGARRIAAALLVAPADPARFGVDPARLRHPLGVPAVTIGSQTDPWLAAGAASTWAGHWRSGFVNLGDAGHVNADSGHGALPRALHLTHFLIHRVEQSRRPARAAVQEFSFAI